MPETPPVSEYKFRNHAGQDGHLHDGEASIAPGGSVTIGQDAVFGSLKGRGELVNPKVSPPAHMVGHQTGSLAVEGTTGDVAAAIAAGLASGQVTVKNTDTKKPGYLVFRVEVRPKK